MKKTGKFFFCCLLIVISIPSFVFGKIYTCDYTNMCPKAIMLTVPYFSSNKSEQSLDLILNYGDLYHNRGSINGYVCEKYGLMPNIATNAMAKNDNDIPLMLKYSKAEIDKQFLLWKNSLYADNMPQWWIDKNLRKYKFLLKSLNSNLRKYNELNNEAVNDYSEYAAKELKRVSGEIQYESSLTNITEADIEKLYDPNIDIDGDGLNNREEYYCGSNPLLKEGFAIMPKILEIIPDGSFVVTGKFSVLNLSSTNLTLMLRSSINDVRYLPKLKVLDNVQVDYNYVNPYCSGDLSWLVVFPSKSETKFVVLFDKEYLPYVMVPYYIELMDPSPESSRRFEMNFYISGDCGKKITEPEILSPPNGTHASISEKLTFLWDIKEDNNFDLGKTMRYKWQCFSLETRDSGYTYDRKVPNFTYDICRQGNYIWRVIKGTDYLKPSASEWGWFSIGKDIAPNYDKSGDFSKCFSYTNHNGQTIYEHVMKVDSNYLSPAIYSSSVVKKISYTNKDLFFHGFKLNDHWYFSGTTSRKGIYRYSVYVHKYDGTVETNKHVFTVYGTDDDIYTGSYYYLNNNEIRHTLKCNIGFDYEAKTYYDYFTAGGEKYKLDKDCQVYFDEPMPAGLNGIMTNGNFIISGIPKKAITVTNYLNIVKNNAIRKERHIFDIKTLKSLWPVVDR
ncbi:hypothetical protein IKW72_00070 [bacterium]|nr:hypothetical protein [bacterium]